MLDFFHSSGHVIDRFRDVHADNSSHLKNIYTFLSVDLRLQFIKIPPSKRIPDEAGHSGVSQNALLLTASAMHRATGAVAGEVQKDAVVLRLRVQRLHHVIQTGRRTGAGAQAPGQHSGGGGAAGRQRARAVRVLAWGRLWEDAGGRML